MSLSLVVAASHRAPAAVLLGATMVWGASFPVTKVGLEHASASALVVGRFTVAALVLGAVMLLRRTRPSLRSVRIGAGLGVVMGLGMAAQTAGLQQTPAGIAGMLSGLAVALVPVIAWALWRQPVAPAVRAGIGACAVGVVLLAGPISLAGAGPGIAFSLLAVAVFAVHILGLSRVPADLDTVALTAAQAAAAAGVAAGLGAVAGQPLVPADPAAWPAVLLLALGATCLGLGAQTWAQPRLSAVTAAVLMAGEPLSAAALGAVLLGEALTTGLLAGGVLVVSSMVLVQLPGAAPRRRRERIPDLCCVPA